jgi:hypothetical protein
MSSELGAWALSPLLEGQNSTNLEIDSALADNVIGKQTRFQTALLPMW